MRDYATLDPKTYFDEHGYFIFRGLIAPGLVERLLEQYRSTVLPSRRPFFRQSTDRWMRNRVNAHGYCQDSFLDIHDLDGLPGYSGAALELFCAAPMREALFRLTGERDHSLMQSMFFDQNTATAAHVDNYYLDTLPGGHLLAAWIALEDIDERAGRFYVVPGSNRHRFALTEEQALSNDRFLELVDGFLADHRDRVYAPALAKGDVLFWSSATVHGSLPTQDERFSRKSLTAHYMPSRYRFGNAHGAELAAPYGEFQGMRFRRDERRYSLATVVKDGAWNFIERRPALKKLTLRLRRAIATP